MPRYRYLCDVCSNEQMAFHLYNEQPDLKCNKCESVNSLEKMVTSPMYFKARTEAEDKEVGEVTREYIEKNREVLEEEKLKAKEQVYESS